LLGYLDDLAAGADDTHMWPTGFEAGVAKPEWVGLAKNC
jgi:hypothetical protein